MVIDSPRPFSDEEIRVIADAADTAAQFDSELTDEQRETLLADARALLAGQGQMLTDRALHAEALAYAAETDAAIMAEICEGWSPNQLRHLSDVVRG